MNIVRENGPETEEGSLGGWNAEFTPVSGGYMIRINGFPLYQLGVSIGEIADRVNRLSSTKAEIIMKLTEARPSLEFVVKQSYLPIDSKRAAQNLLAIVDGFATSTTAEVTPTERANLIGPIIHLYTILARDLAWFDLYWIRPKLGYQTTALLADATVIFPESIKGAISESIKYEVQQAANCLLYEAPSAVGFHVLRAVEMIILDYFTIAGYERAGANNWTDYAKRLRYYKVHRKIVAMIERLATLHRNELMHAEAVLSVEEASILFALMQEVLPIMIADVAKRKGAPIADFPILKDPRWQS